MNFPAERARCYADYGSALLRKEQYAREFSSPSVESSTRELVADAKRIFEPGKSGQEQEEPHWQAPEKRGPPEEDQEVDDLQLAWEALDNARRIYCLCSMPEKERMVLAAGLFMSTAELKMTEGVWRQV